MVTAAQPLSDSVLSAGWSYPARVLVSSIPKDEARWLTMVSPDTIVIGDCGWDDTGAWNLDALRHQGRVDIFTPNIDEALAYTGAKTARDAAVELATVFATVVVTCGAGGAVLAHAGEVIEVEAPDVTVTDTTGAGECFNAALGFGLINPQWSWELRLRCAVLAASISVTRSGHTSAPTLDDVAELASRLGGQWAQLATALDG